MRTQGPAQQRFVSYYFLLAYAISWTAALLIALPYLLKHQAIPQRAGLLMFPVMLLGPCCAGLLLTGIQEGSRGVRNLFSRMCRLAPSLRWYAALLIPPSLILLVLFLLKTFVSERFQPNLFVLGISFGCVAGFFEEIGWTGYAFPRMCSKMRALPAALALGLLWGIWHFPVIDYLGAARPHGPYLFRFFLAFIAILAAIRVLIGWLYVHTQSVAMAQLFHASSTGALVVFGATNITPAQETFWYAVYAAALWIVVALVVMKTSSTLSSP
jgi:membrane protease YdiL (CAAX protease family)